jgi:hypothetical protein
VKESEIRRLFLRIGNFYSSFAYDDYKVEEWRLLLENVPFARATENLAAYTLNPANTFPPHPGVLASSAIQQSVGPAILNAAETQLMLEGRDQEYDSPIVRMPEQLRERMKRFGQSSSDV